MVIKKCRLCGGELGIILPLGKMPIVNYFPRPSEIKKERKYPLNFCVCKKCGLAQLDYIVTPEKIFTSYHYVSGASKPLIDHLNKLAKYCIKKFHIKKGSRVLDIGAGDGVFLSNFSKKTIAAIGIDPARDAAKFAKKRGVAVLNEFFNDKTAIKLASKYGTFDLICATHVLANIVDIADFMHGIKRVLSNNGTLVIEVGSVKDMLVKGQFDSIYHEHYSYFSQKTLELLLKKNGFQIFKMEHNPFHGGSIRIFSCHAGDRKRRVTIKEKINISDYSNFVKSVKTYRDDIEKLFEKIKDKKVVGIGAPAKSVTFLNYFHIGKDKISYIVDSTKLKQKRVLPGVHIPIYEEAHLRKRKIDFFFILAWNYSEYILDQLVKKHLNTDVIIPFPKLKIIRSGRVS